MASPEIAGVYAALILNDDNIEITNEKIKLILNTAGVHVESYWIDLFADYFKTHDINELIKGTSFGDSHSIDSPLSDNQPEINNDNQRNKKEEEEEEIPGGFDDLFN